MPRLEDLRIKKLTPERPSLVAPPKSAPPPTEKPPALSNEREFASVYEDIGAPKGGPRRWGLWVVALGSAIFLLFALSFLFTKATVAITPKSADVNLSETFSAVKSASGGTTLPFDVVVLEGTESKAGGAGEEKEVNLPATGRVIIYNSYSSSPQPLAIETRLEGSNGKIYKTDTKLTVPGMKGSTPGAIEVGVHAAEAGPASNSGPLDFKIFGFKGTPKYTKFYARSKGDLSGGFTGVTTVLSPEDKERAISELKIGLESKLFKRASDQLPEGFVLFKGGSSLDITPENISVSGEGDSTTISIKGTFTGIIFDAGKLAKKIAAAKVPKYDNAEVFIPNIENLNFSLSNVGVPLGSAESIVFSLTGPAKVVWKVDTAKISQDILGKKKRDLNSILAGYPGVASAELVLRPFWKTTFPDKEKSIEVTVNNPR